MKTLFNFLCVSATAVVICGCAPNQSNSRAARFSETEIPTSSATAADSSEGVSVHHSSDIFSTRPEDNQLVSRMRAAISEHPGLAALSPAISIGASDGLLALFGTVRSQSEKDRIDALARTVPGVKSVYNQLQVANIASAAPDDVLSATSRNDEKTAADVNIRDGVSGSAMQSGAETATQGVVDETSEQVAPTARSDDRSRIYEAEQPDGGAGIQVEVQGASQNDHTLAQQLGQQLRADPSLTEALSRVRMSVADGRVLLQGSVRNEVQKREVEAAVQRITGISSIDNQLRVDASGTDPLPRNP